MEFLGRAVLLVVIAYSYSFVVTRDKRETDGSCEVTITDYRVTLQNGQNYTSRCDVYDCNNGTVTEKIHKCEKKLTYTEYGLCHRWSSDECCCDEVGCEDVHGVVQPKGTWYLKYTSSNPARPECGTFCYCGAGPRKCRVDLSCFIIPTLPPPVK